MMYDYFQNLEDEIGYAIGVVSSLFYVGSRTGQMFKNVSTQINLDMKSNNFLTRFDINWDMLVV